MHCGAAKFNSFSKHLYLCVDAREQTVTSPLSSRAADQTKSFYGCARARLRNQQRIYQQSLVLIENTFFP